MYYKEWHLCRYCVMISNSFQCMGRCGDPLCSTLIQYLCMERGNAYCLDRISYYYGSVVCLYLNVALNILYRRSLHQTIYICKANRYELRMTNNYSLNQEDSYWCPIHVTVFDAFNNSNTAGRRHLSIFTGSIFSML